MTGESDRSVGSAWRSVGRRKVVQWALAYAAAAWTLLQVLEYLAETYDWPPAIRQIAVPALSLGALSCWCSPGTTAIAANRRSRGPNSRCLQL